VLKKCRSTTVCQCDSIILVGARLFYVLMRFRVPFLITESLLNSSTNFYVHETEEDGWAYCWGQFQECILNWFPWQISVKFLADSALHSRLEGLHPFLQKCPSLAFSHRTHAGKCRLLSSAVACWADWRAFVVNEFFLTLCIATK
jgi:hypothetical protein